jgi:hypothetical protein
LSTARYHGAAALFAALGIVALASCSWMPFGGKKADTQPAAACPIAVILKPLANTIVFRPGVGPDPKPVDVAFYGIYSDISASCQPAGDALRVALDSVIAAERGSATAQGNDVDLGYFVSLTASDQTVLGKKSFGVRVSIPDRAKRGGVSDHVEIVFPTGGRPISDLNITAGFQQTQQAIQYYKNFRGR